MTNPCLVLLINIVPLLLFLSATSLFFLFRRCVFGDIPVFPFVRQTEFFTGTPHDQQCAKSAENAFFGNIKRADAKYSSNIAQVILTYCSIDNAVSSCRNISQRLELHESDNSLRDLKSKCIELISTHSSFYHLKTINYCSKIFNLTNEFKTALNENKVEVFCATQALWPKGCPGNKCEKILQKEGYKEELSNSMKLCQKCSKYLHKFEEIGAVNFYEVVPLLLSENDECYKLVGEARFGLILAQMKATKILVPMCYGIFLHYQKIIDIIKKVFGASYLDFVKQDAHEVKMMTQESIKTLFLWLESPESIELQKAKKAAYMMLYTSEGTIDGSYFCNCDGLDSRERNRLQCNK